MRRLKAFLLALALALAVPVLAGEAAPAVDDPALEKRVTKLGETLRCLVCQNQTIADSHADLAVDLKNQIREKIKAGMSDEQILDYMVQRYGDFVLYKPPVKSTTWLLWAGPFVLMVVGIVVLFAKLRSRARKLAASSLTEAEHEQAMALLGETAGRNKS